MRLSREQLVEAIVRLSGAMPNALAHRRWLETLKDGELIDRHLALTVDTTRSRSTVALRKVTA